MAILPNLVQENEILQAKLAEMAAEMERLRSAKATKLTMKVSEKGALSLYGMGRWPVTLYRSQWERLLKAAPEIEAFIAANATLLAVKAD